MDEIFKIWIPFIGLLSSITLALFVFRLNPRNWVFRTYILYVLYVAILHLGLLNFPRLANLGTILLPIGFFQLILALTKGFTLNNKIILVVGYIVGIPLSLIGPGQTVYSNLIFNLVFGGFFIYSAWLLYIHSKKTANPMERVRIAYLVLAIWMVLLKFLIDAFSSLGWILSPFWNITLVLQPFIVAYAIIKFRPMDFLSILRKTTIYALISVFIVFSYLLLSRIFEDFCQRVNPDLGLTFLPSLLAGLTLAVIIQGVGGPLSNLLERIFFYNFYRKWSVINKLTQTLSQIFDRDLFLGTVLNAVTSLVDIEKSSIVLYNKGSKNYEIQFAFGLTNETRRKVRFTNETPLIQWLKENNHPLLMEEVRENLLFEGLREEIIKDLELIDARATFPFVVDGTLMGFLTLGKKKNNRPYRWEEVKLIDDLCQQISGVLVSMTFYDQKIKEYLSIIQAFAFSMEAKDKETKHHCERVAEYASAIGRKLNLPPEMIESLRLGGMIHDIGKLTISDDILLKPGSLSEEEFEKIKKHTRTGLKILVPIQFSKEIIDCVLSHHERLSGEGYPDALKGDEIPLVARIMAVADVYDAMTSDRQYRKALSKEEVKAELLRGAGKEYDPEVVHALLSIVDDTSTP